MQSLAEFMAESFNSNVPLTWDLSGLARAVAFERRGNGGPWHVTFEVAKGDSTEIAHSAFAIFNGVFQAVAEFIEVRAPETLVFATKRDELANIYQTYLRKWSAKTEELGYRLDGPIRVDPYTRVHVDADSAIGVERLAMIRNAHQPTKQSVLLAVSFVLAAIGGLAPWSIYRLTGTIP